MKGKAPQVVADLESGATAPEDVREKLEGLTARYLTQEWEDGHALNAVARFHLGNGARLERLNWMADTSAKGMNRRRVVSSGAVEKLARALALRKAQRWPPPS